MPIQSAEHWRQKADLARNAAEKMRSGAVRNGMLQIAELYDTLAEQTREFEAFAAASKK